MRAAARAESITVERLIQLVADGRVRIPKFQRAFAWDASDRRDLLDSIYRGYPVGTLLLWKNPSSTEETSRAFRGVTEPSTHEVLLVVDGQQRITTLWDALGRKPEPKESALVFDMGADAFKSRPLSNDELEGMPPTDVADDSLPPVPVYLLLDAALLGEWVPRELSREVRRRYFELGKQLREYQLAAYMVEDANVEVLRRIFDRVNNSGKKMTRDEVFDAIIGSRIIDGNEAGLQLINSSVRDAGFGEIDRSTILNALEAVRGLKIGSIDPHAMDPADAEADLKRVRDVLGETVRFLRDRADVPHVNVCPYELPLVVLARFFSLFPRPSERNLVLLRRWFWRGTLAERLSGASASIQRHLDDVIPGDEDGSVQRLLRRTGQPDVSIEPRVTEKLSAGTARGKAQICALLAQSPRDLRTGHVIAVADLFEGGSGDVLRRIIPVGGGEGSSLASKLLHPSLSSGAKRVILACEDEGALMSHGIDTAALDALRADDAKGFVHARASILERWIGTFFDRHTECARSDDPPLLALTRRSA